MTTRITIDLPEKVVTKLQKDADAEKRYLKNHIEFLIIKTTDKK